MVPGPSPRSARVCDLIADHLLASEEGWEILLWARPEGTGEPRADGCYFQCWHHQRVSGRPGSSVVGSCSLSFSKMSPQCHLGWRTRDIFLVAKARGVCHSGHLPGEGRAPVAFRSLLFTWFCPHQEATRRRLTPIPSSFGLTWDHQGEGPEEPALSRVPQAGVRGQAKTTGEPG